MKSLRPVYFAAGMAGMFSLPLAAYASAFAALPALHGRLALALASLALAFSLAWLAQFRRRYGGSMWLLRAFAASGFVTLALVVAPLDTQAVWLVVIDAVAGLAVVVLFCVVALHTRPGGEHGEGAL